MSENRQKGNIWKDTAIVAALITAVATIIAALIQRPPPQPIQTTVPDIAVAAFETPTATWTPTAVPAATATDPETVTPPAPPTATDTPAPIPPTDTPTATPEPEAGATWVNPTDGSVYIYVPAGEFTMGTSDRGYTITYVDGFWIKQTEVTNAEYARCVEADRCTAPNNERWDDLEYANHPVTHMSWHQARAYANWVGGRLPTEAQWEKACRGGLEIPVDPLAGGGEMQENPIPDRLYPWGHNPPTAELANFDRNIGDTTPVRSYSDGVSPYGVRNMAGNVWEWTSSLWIGEQGTPGVYPYDRDDGREDPDAPGKRVLRGGAFDSQRPNLRCSIRKQEFPDEEGDNYGFRLVRSEME